MDTYPRNETKPINHTIRSNITRLPALTKKRKFVRLLLRSFVRLLVWIFLDVKIEGMENFPAQGPVLIVSNHLGDADAVLGVACTPRLPELVAKSELYDLPVVGGLMEALG